MSGTVLDAERGHTRALGLQASMQPVMQMPQPTAMGALRA